MKQLLRRGIDRMPAPIPFHVLDAVRFVRHPQVRRRRRMHRQILDRLESPDRIAQGPFRGMHYLPLAYCSEVLPKLLGTYECELAPAIEAICRAGCDRMIVIGAAEGYYAVGMALRNPGATIVGFEVNPTACYYLRRLSQFNGVADRVRTEGACVTGSLDGALAGARRTAIICDCEGAEDELLQPDRVESLRRALILVETHDGLVTDVGVLEGVTRRLRERFASTHDIEVIDSRPRTPEDLPPGCDLGADEAAEAMNEGRPWARWLFMTPRPSPSG
jgi:hypothetical protein